MRSPPPETDRDEGHDGEAEAVNCEHDQQELLEEGDGAEGGHHDSAVHVSIVRGVALGERLCTPRGPCLMTSHQGAPG